MAELLTTTVFYQNTVREYSGNVVHQVSPENRKENLLSRLSRSSRKAYYQQEDYSLRYRDFTHKVFRDSNILNEAWHRYGIQYMGTYRYDKYLAGSSTDSTSLRQVAEQIILELASQGYKNKIMQGIFKKDPRLYYHSIEVMCVAMTMARHIGYDMDSIHDIGVAAVLHDIGKVFLPHELLHLTKEPTDLQRKKLQKVPVISASVAKRAGFNKANIIDSILSHQENYIGNGYPFAKMQKEIHPFGMLIHVADDYDTMVLRKRSPESIKNYIMKMACRRYSFAAVNAFNDLFQ